MHSRAPQLWRWARRLATVTLVAFVLWQLGQAASIHAKARLAQYLIRNAWQQALAAPGEAPDRFRPWPWADTWPVARLQWVETNDEGGWRLRENLWVLAGADGSSLAFGPGHLHGTAAPGEGTSAIAGHRDTHFDFLRHLEQGDRLKLQTRAGIWQSYRVSDAAIVDVREQAFRPALRHHRLYLITCYPFDVLQAGGPLRYVVTAEPDELPPTSAI